MSAGSAGSNVDRPLLQMLDAVEFVAHHDNAAVVIRDGNVMIAAGTETTHLQSEAGDKRAPN